MSLFLIYDAENYEYILQPAGYVVLAALLFIGRMAQISNVESITRELEGEDPEEQPARSRYLRQVPENVEIFDVQGPFFFGAVEQFKDRVFRTL